MNSAHFTFDSYLRFFLTRQQQTQEFINHPFDWRASIKDMVESLGVPHAEIGALVVNGVTVDFEYIVQPDDRIEVHGHKGGISSLRPPYPGRPCFVLDIHLGRLAAYLRMMGFDTWYRNDYDDEELAAISHRETRILLTRDVGLLKRSLVIYGYYVRSTAPPQQLIEVARHFDLTEQPLPFKYCMKCNGLLAPVDKAAVLHSLPRDTADHYDRFHQCQSCQQVYWKGAHYQRMQTLMDAVLRDAL